jgi:hypothetical protein
VLLSEPNKGKKQSIIINREENNLIKQIDKIFEEPKNI